jgi:ADP-ribose pyrophosphatase YjhB (NUDIX family)
MSAKPAQALIHDSVASVAEVVLRTSNREWDYALANAAAIDENWQRASASNPHYFNGVVHLVDEMQLTDGVLQARLLRTDFKSYLFWRDAGFPQSGVRDGFGSALIMSSDCAVLLGRQREGNVNGGLAYLPGGFIDARDVDADGQIDIAASIARELAEETGLGPADVVAQPGFLVTQTGAHVSIAVTHQAKVTAEALKSRIEKFIAADTASELTEMVVVRCIKDLDGLAMPSYARVLLTSLLSPAA